MIHQSVLLVGLGESGLACARWVVAQGARLAVVDTRDQPPGLGHLQALGVDIPLHTSLQDVVWQFDRVVVSPGLPPAHPLMQSVLNAAQAHGTPVESELDLMADALISLKSSRGYAPQVVGITGTNGKTTTTKMVECLAGYAGKKAMAAGNISPAALDALRECLLNDDLPDIWVLELSSFQLHWTTRLRCDASVVLNITQDHLDWHADMDEYARDKFRIYAEHSVAVVNRDDVYVNAAPIPKEAHRVSFGLNAPAQPGDFGLLREGGMLWLSQAYAMQDTPTSRRAKLEPVEVGHNLLMPTDALQVVGLHNAANALAALALCQGLGLPMAKLLHGLRSYKGEPHRVEFVMSLGGVDYFDDSKGTNVGATVAALTGLARSVILIAGGDGKGQDFSPLASPVAEFAKAVVLIGKDAEQLESVLTPAGVQCIHAATLEDAVKQAHALATAGDCVLLSPACASLDMFNNYAHRAAVFVSAVRQLAMDGGQPC
ncbi:UDP-N-acetylmuramoyl-L-alanine--D-glutamate ligase [Limnobacter humi]|uniref:UDP-N-acetylmuramoylalanine--D-glutamate ligase n=1 Tax=Limnobacter humi TaxID=1778671 RepID=A0ABT1WHS1_9BURK|nr:UDP-N-acetylmuramoyl-L-alanine--D-glutamate ligase [Limnobacter humi]MCQ8897075.1 UDP-N-acetylmuramoyl-L-alanine--D-glutamate ligase [Limnobacter humi]